MTIYLIVKTIHIVSATILFGTGLGIALFFVAAHLSKAQAARLFAARTTVLADFAFTLPAAVAQPLSGAWLIANGGFNWTDRWLVYTYALYFIATLCWVPVVIIQIRMKQMLERSASGELLNQHAYDQMFRWWFALGWPAFAGLITVFFLMVSKPSW
jgi:uncharacterized membrane protein